MFQHFHASEDRQWVRDMVFDEIQKLKNDIRIYNLYAQKCKTHPSYQNKPAFYSLLGGALVKYLLKTWKESEYEKIVIVFDRALRGKEQKAFYKAVKPKVKAKPTTLRSGN